MTSAWKEVIERRLVGGMLANCAFNLAQGRSITEREREILDGLRRQWDAIKAVPATGPQRKRKTRKP
jgi:hypothetical protein